MTDRNYTFHGYYELMEIANKPELQADEKPLFAVTKDNDTPYTLDKADASGMGAKYRAEQLDGFKAVYNPASGHVFDTVTDEYEVINPPEFVGPLAERLSERNRTGVHGTVWARQDGASAYAQLLFDTDEFQIWPEDGGRTDPVRAGFNLRWSHNGGMSVKAEGIAQDGMCSNTIRQVTSPIHVKHSGDVDERVDWGQEWDHVLDQMGAFCNALGEIIDEAIAFRMFDLSTDNDQFTNWREATEPLDTIEEVTPVGPITEAQRDALYGYYELMGFPKYLGVSSVARLMWRLAQKDDPRIVTSWDVHSGATYALSNALRGTPGASDDDYHRTASDMLMNPAKTIDAATREARSRLTPDDEDQALLDVGEDVVIDDTGDALRQYTERARTLETAFGGGD